MVDETKRQILLVEYQKAQDSAEHHDQLLWVVVGLLLTGMAGLLAIPPGHTTQLDSFWERFYPPVLGIIVSFLLFYFICSFRSFRDQKYERCKAIELILGMKQHSQLESPKFKQIYVMYGLAGISLFIWIFRLCLEWHQCSSFLRTTFHRFY